MLHTDTLLVIWYIFEWVLRVLAIFVVPRNRQPSSSMLWLAIIFVSPPIGWLIFLILGFAKLPKHRRDDQVTLDRIVSKSMRESRLGESVRVPRKYRALNYLAQRLTKLSLFDGNDVQLLDNYQKTIDALIADIDNAKYYVHLEFYIIALDATTEPVFRALAAAVSRGVTVRVLYDWLGVRRFPRRREMMKRFKHDGIQTRAMLPLTLPGRRYTRFDLRNHRKIVTIDGQIGYAGSLNLIDRGYHRRDGIVNDELMVRVDGPLALQLEGVFTTDWYVETSEFIHDPQNKRPVRAEKAGYSKARVVPSGPGYSYYNNLKIITSALYAATEKVTIVNPYFIPEESLSMALVSAAQRGIEVTLINSEAVDQMFVAHAQRSYYEEMLRAGMKIYLYKAPTLLHSKYIVIDDDFALIGSSNMDVRSFKLNHELMVVFHDKKLVRKVWEITRNYILRSVPVDKEAWLARPPRKQLLDNIARLTSGIQ